MIVKCNDDASRLSVTPSVNHRGKFQTFVLFAATSEQMTKLTRGVKHAYCTSQGTRSVDSSTSLQLDVECGKLFLNFRIFFGRCNQVGAGRDVLRTSWGYALSSSHLVEILHICLIMSQYVLYRFPRHQPDVLPN